MALETIGGHRLAVEVEGSGPAVAMIHGLGGSSNVWEPQVRALADRFTIIRADLAGLGRSPRDGTLSFDRWLSDLEAVVERYGGGRVHLLGHSLGTLIAQHYVVRHPNKVGRIALLGAIRGLPEAGRQGMRERAAKARAGGMEGLAPALVVAGTSPATRERRPEVAAFVREFLMRQDAESYAQACEALARADGVDLRQIASPTLLITGTDDAVASPAAIQAMAAELPAASTLILSECGHWTTIEKAIEVNRALRDFLLQA